jgi:hypothetical protein
VTLLKAGTIQTTLKPTLLNVEGISGSSVGICGSADVSVNIDGKEYGIQVYVAEGIKCNILGNDFMQSHNCRIDLRKKTLCLNNRPVGLLSKQKLQDNNASACATESPSLPSELISQLTCLDEDSHARALAVLSRHASIFSKSQIGKAEGTFHTIELNNQSPLKQQPRRLSLTQRKEMEAELAVMLSQGVIRESASPWATPIVLVKKKDGSTRFCIDYRQLNSRTKADAHPIPYQQDILDGLSGSKMFCTLDLKSGFWQVPMAKDDIEKTAFVVPGGHYEFLRMPFGLRNATATFQRLMERTLKGLIGKGVDVFVDDVVVHAPSFEILLTRLDATLQCLKDAGLTANIKKCKLFQNEVQLLGHIVSADGFRPVQAKCEAIQKWPIPTSKRKLREFLGTASYYRKFIKEFSQIAAPLSKLTSVKERWQWSSIQSNAFNTLKEKLTQPPVLTYFTPGYPVIVDTDASATAVGAVLSQVYPEGEKVIAYHSKCLSTTERNYCVTRRELLAILEALRVWRHYLHGVKFVVRTDHSSLTWLQSFKEPEGQLARWLERLSFFDIDLQYRRGAASTNADGLSRRPCPDDCRYCLRRESKTGEPLTTSVATVMSEDVNWSEEQQKDPILVKVLQWIQTKQRPDWEEISGDNPILKTYWVQFDTLFLHEDFMCRRFYLPGNVTRTQILLPKHLTDQVVMQYHIGGHFGIARTQELIGRRFFWPRWKSDVTKCVGTCLPCLQRKGPGVRVRPPMKKYLSSEPFQRVAIDILGPLPLTPSGNKYLLVLTDYFSKWVEALPLPNQEAQTIADALLDNVFTRFGMPTELHSDQGRNFDGNLVKMMCERLGIYKTRTTRYHPQSDGQTERMNRTLLSSLAKLCHDERSWDRVTSLVLLQYRSTVHSATGFTPNMLMFGRDVTLPADLLFPPPTQENAQQSVYMQQLEARINAASELARKHLLTSWNEMKQNAPVSRKLRPIDVSRPVLVFDPVVTKGYSPKLASFWKGPHHVTKKISELLYEIRFGQKNSKIIHRSHLYQPSQLSPVHH